MCLKKMHIGDMDTWFALKKNIEHVSNYLLPLPHRCPNLYAWRGFLLSINNLIENYVRHIACTANIILSLPSNKINLNKEQDTWRELLGLNIFQTGGCFCRNCLSPIGPNVPGLRFTLKSILISVYHNKGYLICGGRLEQWLIDLSTTLCLPKVEKEI